MTARPCAIPWSRRSRLALHCAALMSVGARRAVAQCAPSVVNVDATLSAARWGASIRAMRATLSGSDRPWHCAGATVSLHAGAGGAAVLEVALPAGTNIWRHIAEPTELVPTLQAALIVDALPSLDPAGGSSPAATPPPSPAVAAPPAPAAPPPAPAMAVAPVPPARPRAPRVPTSFVEGIVDTGMRLGATPSYTSWAVRAALVFRIRAWSLFAWGRFEPWTHRLTDRGPGRYLLDFGVLGVGGTLGWPVGRGRVEAGVTVSTDSYSWRDQARLPGQRETFVQVRLGVIARWRSHAQGLGFVVTLDADLSPTTPFEEPPAPTIPRPPAWSAGLMAGLSYGGAL